MVTIVLLAILVCGSACFGQHSDMEKETTQGEALSVTSSDTVDSTTVKDAYDDPYSYVFNVKLADYHCIGLFGCTSEIFFELELDLFEQIGDFRARSYIDQYGYLQLNFTKEQRDKLLESEWLWDFSLPESLSEPEKLMMDIEINSDCNFITYRYSLSAMLNASNDYIYKMQAHYQSIVSKLYVIQTLRGVPYHEIQMTVCEIDTDTGNFVDYILPKG